MLQRYFALHSQQGTLRRRLSISSSSSSSQSTSLKSVASTTASSPDMSASEASSTASSPTLNGTNSFSQISPPAFALPKPVKRRTSDRSRSMSPIPEDEPTYTSPTIELSPDEQKLYDVNHDIKSTLTELLNCDAVKNDSKMRLWVQTRLMDAEQALKRQRKRRVSTPSIVLSSSEEQEPDRRVSM